MTNEEMTFPEMVSNANHKHKYAIIGQGVMEDESLNSVACCGTGNDYEALVAKCRTIAEEFVKDMRNQEQEEPEENDRNTWRWRETPDGAVVIKNLRYHDSQWSVVEIMWD